MVNKLSALLGGPGGLLLLVFFFIPAWVSITCAVPFFLQESSVMDASGYELASGSAADELAIKTCDLAVSGGGTFALEDAINSFNDSFAEEGFGGDTTVSTGVDGMTSCDDATFDEFIVDSNEFPTETFDPIQADARLWLIPFAALATIGLAVLRWGDIINGLVSGTGYLLIGIAVAAVMLLKYLELSDMDGDLQAAISDVTTEDADPSVDEFASVGGSVVSSVKFGAGFILTGLSMMLILAAGVVGLFEDATPQPDVPDRYGPKPLPDLASLQGTAPSPPPPSPPPAAPQTPKRPSWLDD